MADEEVEETPEVDETEFDPARARAALEKKNREAQNLRLRLKELEPLAQKAKELEEAQKTAAQKEAEARAAAEERAAKAELLLLKRDVAEKAGLPKSWASRLQGSTEAELEADAKELAKDLPTATKPAGTGRPVPDLRSAALPAGDGATAGDFDADAWIRSKAGK